jgi:hypothetical protein
MQKVEIIAALEKSRHDFQKSIEGLSSAELEEPGVMDDFSVKDLMVHITMWEAELVKLLWQADQGITPTTVHFQKYDLDELNSRWFQANKDRPLGQVMADFTSVRKQTIRRLSPFSEEDLADPAQYPWQRGQSLAGWIAVNSYEHEAEHIEQILEWREKQGI